MANISSESLSFSAQWYQQEAGLMRDFLLNFYPYDGTIELFDTKTKKTFLKRVRVPGVTENALYTGAKVNIFGRQITIKAYKDDYTQLKVTHSRQMTFCLISSKQLCRLGEIINSISAHNLELNQCAMFEMSRQQCDELVHKIPRFNEYGDISGSLLPGPIVAFVISGADVTNRLDNLLAERGECTSGLSALWREVYYTKTSAEAIIAIEFFFTKSQIKLSRSLENTTLCIIKPHAVSGGHVGDILSTIIRNGFMITSLNLCDRDKKSCEEFYRVYKGITSIYPQMVVELSSGPFLAVEIASNYQGAHPCQTFRELCGPMDPSIARQIRPNTLRALFGDNLAQNGVHCSDLEENCIFETDFFFNIPCN